ncbi:MAG: VTT domain-containing protein [Chloroflexota bacterium]
MKNKNQRLILARVLAILFVIAISAAIYSVRDRSDELAAYGYPGIFLIAFLSNATVLMPAPGIAVVFTMGAVFNPLGVALAAGSGGALGELSGYLAGFGGQVLIERSPVYERTIRWMRKYGSPTILILAALPNPFFDIAGLAAGALKMPWHKFLFWCWIGVTIKMLAFAWAGAYSLTWIFGS